FEPRRRKPAARNKVAADRLDRDRRVEINAPRGPRFGMTEGVFNQLGLHPRAFASMAECRTMPHSAELDCRVPRSPSRVRFAGLRPLSTAPPGLSSPQHTQSSFKRGYKNKRVRRESKQTVTYDDIWRRMARTYLLLRIWGL